MFRTKYNHKVTYGYMITVSGIGDLTLIISNKWNYSKINDLDARFPLHTWQIIYSSLMYIHKLIFRI